MPCQILRHFIRHVMPYNMLYVMSDDMSCHMSHHVMACHVMLFYMAWQMSDDISCYISSHILCPMSCDVMWYVLSSHICHVICQVCPCWSFYLDLMTLGWEIVWEKVFHGWWVGGSVYLKNKYGSKAIKNVAPISTHNFHSRATVHIVGCVAPYLQEYRNTGHWSIGCFF